MKFLFWVGPLALVVLVGVTSCSHVAGTYSMATVPPNGDKSNLKSTVPGAKLSPSPGAAAKPKAARVTKRKANTKGDVLILEYHHVLEKEDRWARSRENFLADLERLYKLGYRPVTLDEYLTGKMKLAPGASPVVLTFDDAHPNQFYMLPDGSIDPNCAVGIWREFSKTHPDFPVKATWFVVPNMAFGQPKLFAKKMKMLESWGSEIAVHTITHSQLNKLTDDQVKRELGECYDILKKHGIEAKTIAYPYGVPPKNRVLAKEFVWKDKRYKFTGAVLGGSGPAPSTENPKIRKFALPRIQAIEGDYGITFWLNKAKAGKVNLYVAP